MLQWISKEFSSVIQSYPTLCDPMDGNMPGLWVHHQQPEFTQTHVHWVSDAIQPSHPLSPPSFSCPQSFPALGFPPMSWLFASCGLELQHQFLSVNIQSWFPLGLTDLISLLSKGLSGVFSSTTIQSINSSVLSLLYGLSLTIIHDYWKNHSFDYMYRFQQSEVSAF